ncbi:MAG: tetratricopeptide repeat protein, partial [Trichodesmium sp. St5_bin8]|nr:tetratricopeptide repeat protein [Trichodesmium sp. St5_bin8]
MTIANPIKKVNQLLRERKFDDAFKECQKSIEVNPNFSWNYYYLGKILAAQNKWQEALIQYEEAVKINPNSATFYYSLAKTLRHQGQLDEAIKYLKIAISLKNNVIIYQQTLAEVYEVKFDFVGAFKIWQEIIAINYNHPVATKKIHWLRTDIVRDFVENGDKLNKEGKIKEAVNFYQQALTINSQQPMPIYRNFGNNLITLGKFEEAETVFKQLKEMYPELTDGYEGYARLTHSLGNWELALKRWENAIEKFPENIGFQTQKGNMLINLSRFDEAESVFQSLKEKFPHQPQGYDGYARLTHSFADWNLALKRWENAIEKFPENIGFQTQKGNMLINLSRFDEAESVFQRLIEKFPHQPQGYEGYAKLTHHLGNWELALKRWENAINHLPHHFHFYVQKGNVLITLFRYQEAETLFEELISKYPHQHHGYDGLAKVLMHAQKWELALTCWQTAMDKFPNNLAFLVGKANAYIELHKFDSAQDLADRIFRQYPNYYQQKYGLQKNIILRRYALEKSIASLSKVEDYFRYLLSESEVFSIAYSCDQILLESINNLTQTMHSFITLGIIGIAVKRLLDDYFLEVSPGEILACTFKKLITQKLGNENFDLQQAEILCTEGNFRAAIDIYLNLGDEIIEKFIPDYPEHIDRLFYGIIEHNITADLPEKYGSLSLAKETLEADLINSDFDSDSISIYSQLGYLLVHLGETEKGLAYLNKGVEISIYSQDAYIKLGYALLKLGKKDSAFANYKQAIKLNFALAFLSATLIEWGISKSHQLINSGCQKFEVYQQLSNLLIQKGLSKEALEVVHKVQNKFGDGHYGKKNLIPILVAQGNKQEALKYYQQVLKENPKYADKNLSVLRSCRSLEKFENQTLLWATLCDRFKIAYAIIPKCACSTVRVTMRWLENGDNDDFKIINMPKYQVHKTYWVEISNMAANYFKFVVVREPIKRFLSAFS